MTADPLRGLRSRALAYLARREYTRAELARKLGGDEAGLAGVVNAVLGELEVEGLLSDARAADALVRARRGRLGSMRIERELRDKGVPDDLIGDRVAVLRGEEVSAARAAWAKKFGTLPRDAAERARQGRFLQGRGFSFSAIREVLGGAMEDAD